MIDVDGDMTPDATITDLNTFGPSFHMNESGIQFLEVDLDYGAGELEAIIAIPYSAMGCVVPVELQSFSIE
jgi:hypothetical protein